MSLRLDWTVRSYSFERIRNFPSQPLVRSTTQRLGRTTKPFMSSVRLTTSISSDVSSRTSAIALPVYAPSTQILESVGYSRWASRRTGGAPSRSWTDAGVTIATSSRPSTSTSRCRLRPFTFFSRVEAAWATDVGRLDALAIEDRRRRLGLASLGHANPTAQTVMDRVEHAVVGPPLIPLERRRPRRQIVRKRAPRHTRTSPIPDRVEQLARRVQRLLQVLEPHRRRYLRLDQRPFLVAQVARIFTSFRFHPAPSSTNGIRWTNFLWNTFSVAP